MNSNTLPEVVLVEDNPGDEVISLRGIAKSGIPCNVTVKRDGAEALAFLLDEETPTPALVLLDFKLPKMNGAEILSQLRSHPKTRFVPVVVYSGGATTTRTMEECYRVGANSCVTKLDDFDEYTARVADLTHYWLKVNESHACLL